jgi:thermitase
MVNRGQKGICRGLRGLGLAIILVVAVALVVGETQPAAAADRPGELIVQPAPGVSIDLINVVFGTQTLLKFTDSTQVLVAAPSLLTTLAAMVLNTSLVVWAEPNGEASEPWAQGDDSGADPHRIRVLLLGGDKQYLNQWGVTKVSLDAVPSTAQGAGVVMGVLDTRIDARHPVLSGRTLSEIDLVAGDPQVNVITTGRSRGHGTFVAGVALRAAPAAKVLPVRVLNEDGVGSVATVSEGIRRAAASGARVINMSLSTSTRSRTMEDAVKYALQRGSVPTAAYGNEGTSQSTVYPADFNGVLSVAATDQKDRRASWSNYGRSVGTAAPGVDVIGPFVDGQYASGSGTSFSTAWVSGQAAVLLSAGTSRAEVAPRIVTSADDIAAANGGTKLGFGRINVAGSLSK